jgi:hypothetical protein
LQLKKSMQPSLLPFERELSAPGVHADSRPAQSCLKNLDTPVFEDLHMQVRT